MKKTILFGSTGNLGKKIAEALRDGGYEVTAVVRNEAKAREINMLVTAILVADVTKPATLTGICNGFEIVVSALGKSVSLRDNSKPSFYDVDVAANSNILDEAMRSGVRKFVYVSALGAENFPHLAYFRAHHLFSEKLTQSGLGYAIIKPPALFSAFLDLAEMAKKGRLVTLGTGTMRTNPIAEEDLAKICVEAISQPNTIIEAGGKEVLTRHQINETIQAIVAPGKRVRKLPIVVAKAALPLLKIRSKNTYDKVAFFLAVLQHDVVAPRCGNTTLEAYLRKRFPA